MVDEETNTKEDLPPRSFGFVFGCWLFFAIFSLLKGMKYFRWPQPLSYRGMTVLLLTGIVLFLIWRVSQVARWRRAWQSLIQGDITPPPGGKAAGRQLGAGLWYVGGLCFLVGALTWLEVRDPYFFTQDDNLSQFLPVILQGCESLFETGQLATYNPHQFAGAPTTSIGTYALTYPGTYLSYLIAKYACDSPEATIDVFCILHLLYGYTVLFALLRKVGCGVPISVAGALAFLLQGFFLINGRSWFYMAPTALWLPCLLLLAERLRQGNSTRIWALGTGLVIGVYFHSGNVQMWIYGMSMWVLLLLSWLLTKQMPRRATLPMLGSLLVGFGIALPLFVPQFAEASTAKRIIDGASIEWTLGGLYAPWPIFQAGTAGTALFGATNRQYIGQFMYSGTTFMVMATLVVMSMTVHRWRRKTWGENAYAPLAMIAFAAALGQMGLIWFIFSKLPIFSKFAHPFKYVPIMTLLGVLAGAIAIERVLRRTRRRGAWEAAFALLTIGLLAYHVSLPLPSAFTYGFKPYPQPFESLKSGTADPQRIIALAPYRHAAPQYGRMPVNNLPTWQGLYSVIGYDPIVMRREPALTMLANLGHVEKYNDWGNWVPTQLRERPLTDEEKAARIAALRAYGIETIFSFGASLRPPYEDTSLTYRFYRGDQYLWQLLVALRELPTDEVQIVANTPWGVTYKLKDADPLAFIERDKTTPQSIAFSAQGATINLADVQEGDHLIINLIDEPGLTFLRTYIDGELVSHEVDSWKRIRLAVPPNAKQIAVRYEPPFLKWLLVGIPFVLIGGVIGFVYRPQKPPNV